MKKILLLLIVSLTAILGSAESGEYSNGTNKKGTLNVSWKNTPGRPRVPSNVTLECYYGEGYIGFVFPDGVNMISFDITNETESWSGMVTFDEPVTETPSFSGEYQIECATDNGYTYSELIKY